MERSDSTADDPDALAELNRQFHETIYAAAHNRFLTQTLEQLRNTMALLRGTTFTVPGRAQTAAEEHYAIIDAIKRRDPDAAEQVAREHVLASQKARLQLVLRQGARAVEEREAGADLRL